MSQAVGELLPGQVIIELGPGTGVCTRELLSMFPGNPIIAIEMNDHFARDLRRDLPGVQVLQGCASHLPDLLREHGIAPEQVGAVVSGLPLLSLPRETTRAIIAAVVEVLPVGRPFIQFTYSTRAFSRLELTGLNAQPGRRVWMNLPPATVMPFTRH
jgi:phosphatidylethanolamine/phosphatidyl-N-methylethanolamine N-methyltransferase